MTQREKPNLLLVDDRPENLLALEAILADLEFNIVTADSGKAALRCLLSQDFALILLDVEMPGMDGFETAELIRSRRKTQFTPIIFLTAINKTDQHVFRGYSVGAVDYLFKPFAPEVLKSKVTVFVDLFQKTREVSRQAEQLLESNLQLEETNQKIAGLNREICRKNAELKAEHDFISTILDTAGCLVLLLNTEGRIVLFNRACEQLTAYEFEEIKGRNFWELCLPLESAGAAKSEFERLKAAGPSQEIESEWVARDGERRLVSWHYTTLAGNGHPTDFVIVTGTDVTERKRAEEARIREQAGRFAAEAAQQRAAFLAEVSTLLAASLDNPVTLSKLIHFLTPTLADWCIVYALRPGGHFQPVEVAHGDPAKQELAQSLLNPPLNVNLDTHWIARVLRTSRPELVNEVAETEIAALANRPEDLQVLTELGVGSLMLVPVLSLGEVKAVIALVGTALRRFGPADLSLAEDIGRRAALAMDNVRLYREAQDANRAKDDFLATVSHELRTPLNAILGWTRLVREENLDKATVSRALETIERNGKLQAQLIEDILDASRIITGKLRLSSQPVEIVSVIRAALDAVRPAANAKGIWLEENLNSSYNILGDADRLQQIAWNLLTNAIKFTPKEGKVRVKVERIQSSVQLSVTDTGKGIKPEFLPHVFDRFSQAEQTFSRTHGGLGLGLAIVHNLVELHGGTVHVESPGEGRGATFLVKLPIAAVSPDLGEEEIASSNLASGLKGLRVLVVDDEMDARDMLSHVLQGYGLEAETAASAREALAMVESYRPDVIVSDIGMPE
ncbi:MAG: response regulator, partial [Acidobacteria bacterium]|nr:response regulator [Acidobacteriota bacterium]